MRFASVLLLIASAAVVSAHVAAVYEGMYLPIRSSTGQADEPASTAGPCGGAETFGSNGITTIKPGTPLTMQLQYAAGHNSPQNYFSVAMMCQSQSYSNLNSDAPLQLSQPQNAANRLNVAPVGPVEDQNVWSIPFIFPDTSPSGQSLKSGDYCTMSIQDQRNWGGCVDVKVGSNPGPIIAGVMTPVLTIGAAAALWFGRGRIQGKLLPESGAASPDRKMWSSIRWCFLIMMCAIISCSVPSWTTLGGFKSGPWLLCPTNGGCLSSASSGFYGAVVSARFFVITAVLASIAAFAAPLLVFYNKLDAHRASQIQFYSLIYVGFADFIAFMVWVCIFTAAATPGWALYLDVATFALAFAGTIISRIWINHIAAAPADTPMKTSGPVITSSGGVSAGPKSYPNANKSFTPTSSGYAAPGATKAPASAAIAGKLEFVKKYGDWEEMWDEESQAYYFFNHTNGDSAWERPTGWPVL